MKPITLKPTTFRGTVYCSPNFLSNGHWAIRKVHVRNAGLFDSAAAVEAQDVQFREQTAEVEASCYGGAAAKAAGRTWTLTSLVWRNGKDSIRLLLADDTGDLAGIRDAFLTLLAVDDSEKLEALDACSPFVRRDEDGQVDVVIMPMRIEPFPYTVARKALSS